MNAQAVDGVDTSWLYDVPFERLAGRQVRVIGAAAADMSLRLNPALADLLLTWVVGDLTPLTDPIHDTRVHRARERRLSGTVWLNALVDETGAVVEVSLVRASPPGLDFEGAATRWLRTRVYRPATTQGVPVRVWVPVMVEFRHPDR